MKMAYVAIGCTALQHTSQHTSKKTNKQCFLIELLKMRKNFFKVFYNIEYKHTKGHLILFTY